MEYLYGVFVITRTPRGQETHMLYQVPGMYNFNVDLSQALSCGALLDSRPGYHEYERGDKRSQQL